MRPLTRRAPRWWVVLLMGAAAVALPQTAVPVAVQAAAGDGPINVTVVRDVNSNGTWEPTLEPGVAGLPVTVTDDAGASISGFTGPTGLLVLDPAPTALTGGKYRVEVTIPPALDYLQPAEAGPGLSTLVNFIDVSGGAPANLTVGVWNPYDYTDPDPQLVSAYQNNSSLTTQETRSLISFPFSSRGDTTAPANEATQIDTGTVYGIAVERGGGRIFSSAYAKRHTVYGPGGNGAIYVTQGGITSVFATVPNVGSSTHDLALMVKDAAFYDVPGKESLGDLELSEDGTTLYVVNQFDKSLYVYDAVTAAPLGTFPIPDPGCPGGAGNWRPTGLGFRDGTLYVGGVCSAESTGVRADLRAVVWAFDASTNTFGGTPVVNHALDFLRGRVQFFGAAPAKVDVESHWNPWVSTFIPGEVIGGMQGHGGPPGDWFTAFSTPLLSDVAIETDGSLILGFRDRTSDQLGFKGMSPNAGDSTLIQPASGGDIVKVCMAGGALSWQGEGGCPNNHVVPNGGAGQNPAVVEFFPGDFWGDPGGQHYETAQGAIALAPGINRLATTSMDPYDQINSSGVGFYSRAAGDMQAVPAENTGPNAYEFLRDDVNTPEPEGFGKANGLADLEVIGALAPIQIGNYVWFDADRDGQQDPGETPIPGLTVELLDGGGNVIGTTVTDATGQYFFGGSGDPQLLQPNTSYTVRIPNARPGPAQQGPIDGLTPTGPDQGSDTTDSDGIVVGGASQVAITTGPAGFNNHTYDFGFSEPIYDLALRKTLAAGQSPSVYPGDLVTFTITVFNQGPETAANIQVTDYIPDGLTLEDTDWAPGAGNTATITLPGTLVPAASTTVDISLRLSTAGFTGTKDNYAEISSFTGEFGDPATDIDSTPDGTNGNDELVDDEITDNPTTGTDEDDHDIASIQVGVFDLALRKTLAAGQSPTVSIGDNVAFTITVFNQGTVAAQNVTVADDVPAGFTFSAAANPGWAVGASGKPETVIAGPIAPGASAAVTINLTATSGAVGNVVNNAEITRAEDPSGRTPPDIDSLPDPTTGNDGLTDDVIDNANGDEDDQDIAAVVVLAAVPPTAPPTTLPNPGTLPRTGGSSGNTVLFGLFAAGLGLAAVIVSRRRWARH